MDKISNLPSPLKWFMGLAGVGAIFGIGVFSHNLKFLLIFALVLVGLLILLVGVYLLWNYFQRKKQNARLRGELAQSTTASPRGMSATDLAKLDNLRKKFQEGIEAFRTRGKDIYTLPWYVIIGEPGSGKTEAVRHCNVGFPPGMHEGDNDTGYMGAGGTINMNWWFTNHAVLLDTAGRLVFEDVKPGETSEWKEFLKLLKKNRPYCPINGLLLVVPSDSLIKDSADQIASKAGKIAQQLDVIQRVLDFRFPVYVVITKSDKINGFREFFESVTDPQLQHQMMGWSNPEPLDSSFKPDVVDRHLGQVAERLRRRRLGLMRDPVPESAPRRTDEVDALFAMPNSLVMLAPRLRSYLEKIFMPGEWSAKPLFLRGIYFTSSMREGAALDQELAEAIGVSADELPEGKVWERDRAYFLRDLFMDKVFRERGLVTRATNTKDLLRRRQLLLYGCSLGALALFIVVAWLGMRTVRGQVKNRADYWVAATGDHKDDNSVWSRTLITGGGDNGPYALDTDRHTFPPISGKMTIPEFQNKLRGLAEEEIKTSFTMKMLMPGLQSIYNHGSKDAQRVAFETGVLLPLKNAAAARMCSLVPETAEPAQSEALVTLVRLESDIARRGARTDIPMDNHVAANFLAPLIHFVVGTNVDVDTNLLAVMNWTYASNSSSSDRWPPHFLSSTHAASAKDAGITNEVLMCGLDYFIRRATNTVQVMATNWVEVQNLIRALDDMDNAEKDLGAAVASKQEAPSAAALQRLETAKAQVSALAGRCAKSSLFSGGLSLTNAYGNFTNEANRFAGAAFARVEEENRKGLTAFPNNRVFQDIAKRLSLQRNAISKSVDQIVSPDIYPKLARLDDCFMSRASGIANYEKRGSIYDAAYLAADPKLFGGPDSTADLSQKLDKWDSARQQLAAVDYKGCYDTEAKQAAEFFGAKAVSFQPRAFATAYKQRADTDLKVLGFPLFRQATTVLGVTDLEKAQAALDAKSAEIASVEAHHLPANDTWSNFTARVVGLRNVAKAIKPGNWNVATVFLMPYQTTETWRNKYRGIRLGSDDDGQKVFDTSNGDEVKLGQVDVRKPCFFSLFKDKFNPTSPAFAGDQTRNWGLLWILAKNNGKSTSDGSWIVNCPLSPTDDASTVQLKVRFDQPWPELKDWPAN